MERKPIVGDIVYHLLYGWPATVVEVLPANDFPVSVRMGNDLNTDFYTFDLKAFPEDINPTWVYEPPVSYLDLKHNNEKRKTGCMCLPGVFKKN